jgi:membrane dipeptidase
MANAKQSAAARRVYAEALVWDDHSGFMPGPEADLTQLRRWPASGISYLSVNVGFDGFTWERTLKALAGSRAWFETHAEEFLLVDRADDILRAKAEGRLAIAFDIEGMRALDDDLSMVSLYYKLGVRQMLFAYNLDSSAGGGCHAGDAGLTDFGRKVIAEMNRVGMLVDVSHCSQRTSLEAMEASSAPVIFSHSNSKRLYDHGRNITDEQIRACARTGGVIGINGIGMFLGDREATSEAMARHIAHTVEVAGPEHVGIGLDYDWDRTWGAHTVDMKFWPEGAGYDEDSNHFAHASPEQLPELAELLLAHQFSEAEVKGILGGNFLRVAQQVWR